MIWVIGGTKDSREFLESISQKRKDIIVSTATSYGGKLLEGLGIQIHSQAMDLEGMDIFIHENSITTIVDMSHPYAYVVSKNAMEIAKKNNLLYYRFEREIIEILPKKYKIFADVETLLQYAEKTEGNILVTLGSNLLPKFKTFPRKGDCYFRILPKWDMVKKAEEQDILPRQILALQGPFSQEMNLAMIQEYKISYLITKRSGNTGGEKEKIEAADIVGVEVWYVERPKIEYPNSYSDWKKIEEVLS